VLRNPAEQNEIYPIEQWKFSGIIMTKISRFFAHLLDYDVGQIV
jgi:hypothetical protein